MINCLCNPSQVSAVAWISMVMSAFLGLLAMTVVFSSFYVMRSWSQWLSGVGGQSAAHERGSKGCTPRVHGRCLQPGASNQ